MVLVALGLAVTAIFLALRSQKDRQQAERARESAESLLYESSLAPIRAQRLSGGMGQRLRGLEAVEVAARIRPSAELREQAISTFALADFEDAGQWRAIPTNTVHVHMNPALDKYVYVDANGNAVVCRWSDGHELFRLEQKMSVTATFFGNDYLAARQYGLRVWNATNGALVFAWKVKGEEDRINDMSIDSVRGRIATTDAKGVLRVHDLSTGKLLVEDRTIADGYTVRFDPLGTRLAIERANEYIVWDWQNQKTLQQTKRTSWTGDMRWTPDGNTIAIGNGNNSIKVWDLQTAQIGELNGHTREIVSLMPHPAQPYLVSFAWDNSIRVWDSSGGNALLRMSGLAPIGFSPDGSELAVWNGPKIGKLRFHSSYVYRSLGITAGAPAWSHGLAFSPNSELLAGNFESSVCIWNAATGQRRGVAAVDRCFGVWFEDDNTILILHSQSIERLSIPSADSPDSNLKTISNISFPDSTLDVGAAADFDPRLQRIVVGVQRKSQGVILDAKTGTVKAQLKGQYGFNDPVFSPNGRWVASGCWHPTITTPMSAVVWDAQNGQMITNFPTIKCSVRFSPDSRYLILGAPQQFTVIDTETWQVARRLERNETMIDVGYAAFQPGRTVAALHATDSALRLVDVATGTEFARLSPPDKRIMNHLEFSADGRFLAAATQGNVQLWDLTQLKSELTALGLNWESPPLARRSPRAPAADTRFIIPVVYAAIVLTVALALLLLRHQRNVLARYQEVDDAIVERTQQLAATERELLHSQKMRALGTLAAGIAHDFNNLLSVIRVSNKLIERRAKSDESITANTEDIEQAVEQGKNVVQAMLGYSREDTAPQQPFVLAELVEDVLTLLSKHFLAGITLTLDLDRSAIVAALPRARIEQLLLNLIVNASEAMDGQGRLAIVVRTAPQPTGPRVLEPAPAPSYAELIVADSGAGISPKILPRIFEPFFTTKTVGANRGTGLGLSMVYTIARDCGLGIHVEGEPGRGARFVIIFPKTVRSGSRPSDPARDSHTPEPLQPRYSRRDDR